MIRRRAALGSNARLDFSPARIVSQQSALQVRARQRMATLHATHDIEPTVQIDDVGVE
jgi:hypothetical protein